MLLYCCYIVVIAILTHLTYHPQPLLGKVRTTDTARILPSFLLVSGSHAPAWECRLDAPASLSRNAGALLTAFPRRRVGTR